MCPALSQGIWFRATPMRAVQARDAGLRGVGKIGLYPHTVWKRAGTNAADETSDELWKIIAFIRSINPPGTNPPEKVIPGRMH